MIAIYVRQSLDKKDSISIESQVDFCKKEFNSKDEKFKVYADKGYSGKNTNRPCFNAMMNDIKTGQITRVIVYRLDRISRSTLDFANINNAFKKNNVEFTSCTEKFDTSTPIGKAMLQIIMVFAELERETIQTRIKDNYYARGKKGYFLGGRVPYGYERVKVEVGNQKASTFSHVFEQVAVLTEIYDMYANTDLSLGKVSDYFNGKNIPAPANGKWDSNKISRMLRNPVYVRADADIYQYFKNKGCIISNELSDFIGVYGCSLYGKREANERKYTNVKDHVLSLALHEGIIDSDTWLLCQYKLDKNKQIKNSGKGKYTWLSGLAKCGYCEYSVSVIFSDKKRTYKYFNCRGKTNLKICKGHSRVIYVEEVESVVEKFLLKKVQELKQTKMKTKKTDNVVTNKLKIKIMEIDKQIENLVNQMAEANNVVMTYVNDKISKLDREKTSLLDDLKQHTISTSKTLPMEQVLEKIDGWKNLTIEEKKIVCGCFINKVFIKDDEITIDWKL